MIDFKDLPEFIKIGDKKFAIYQLHQQIPSHGMITLELMEVKEQETNKEGWYNARSCLPPLHKRVLLQYQGCTQWWKEHAERICEHEFETASGKYIRTNTSCSVFWKHI